MAYLHYSQDNPPIFVTCKCPTLQKKNSILCVSTLERLLPLTLISDIDRMKSNG